MLNASNFSLYLFPPLQYSNPQLSQLDSMKRRKIVYSLSLICIKRKRNVPFPPLAQFTQITKINFSRPKNSPLSQTKEMKLGFSKFHCKFSQNKIPISKKHTKIRVRTDFSYQNSTKSNPIPSKIPSNVRGFLSDVTSRLVV